MSGSTLRFVTAVVLIAHGIGHFMGILSAIGVRLTPKSSSRSWLFTNLVGDTGARAIGVVIWLSALLGFLGAGMSLLGWFFPQNLWQPLAIVSAIISLIGLVFFWNAFATILNKVGALGVDVAVLGALLIFHWPSDRVQ